MAVMTIKVQFFASLREQLGKQQCDLEFRTGLDVANVWQLATGDQAMPVNTLCAINMEYASTGDSVSDGDEVAFFPPVTGG
jgi:molybdopterin synthase sulfur carrier subunit